jgi:hypothetical protein
VATSSIACVLNTHVAGQYALIEVVCDGGERLEYVYHASGRTVFTGKVWYANKDIPLLTEEQIMSWRRRTADGGLDA